MLHNAILSSCNLILYLVLHPSGALGLPVPVPVPVPLPTTSTPGAFLVTRQDETPTASLPARATRLNVFAALFTIVVLIIIACYVIIRLMKRALATLSATVTGSSSTEGSSDSSDS